MTTAKAASAGEPGANQASSTETAATSINPTETATTGINTIACIDTAPTGPCLSITNVDGRNPLPITAFLRERIPLPSARAMSTDQVLARLDSKLTGMARCGVVVDGLTPERLAWTIAFAARYAGASLISTLATIAITPGLNFDLMQAIRAIVAIVSSPGVAHETNPDESTIRQVVDAGCRAERQAMWAAVPVEFDHIAVRPARFPGVDFTFKIFLHTVSTPDPFHGRVETRRTSATYSGNLILEGGELSGEYLTLLDALDPTVPADRCDVYKLRTLWRKQRVRAVLRADGTASRLLRLDGYAR